jgi:hypothetical protein
MTRFFVLFLLFPLLLCAQEIVEVRVADRFVRPAAACSRARVLARQGNRKVVPSGAVAT